MFLVKLQYLHPPTISNFSLHLSCPVHSIASILIHCLPALPLPLTRKRFLSSLSFLSFSSPSSSSHCRHISSTHRLWYHVPALFPFNVHASASFSSHVFTSSCISVRSSLIQTPQPRSPKVVFSFTNFNLAFHSSSSAFHPPSFLPSLFTLAFICNMFHSYPSSSSFFSFVTSVRPSIMPVFFFAFLTCISSFHSSRLSFLGGGFDDPVP